MKVSLKTIAEDLGLSKATVSWIMSGKAESRGFNENTIKMVRDYADKIGYRPNLLARSLSVGATNTIGLIIPAIDDTYYSYMIKAVESEAQKHGYVLVISSSERDISKEKQLIQTLRAQQVDALIIASANEDKSPIFDMLGEKYPFVLIDRYFPSINCNYVIVNNRTACCELTEELISKNARKIAILTSDMQLDVMRMRVEGYSDAIQSNDMIFDNSLIVEVDRSSYRSGVGCKISELLSKHPDVDGFIFTTHYLAFEAIRYFIANGIDYNSNFKMGCFHHETMILDLIAPNMIFSMVPIKDMGAKAVDIAVENIKQKIDFNFHHVVMNNDIEAI